jgi:hypothetical protein
MKRLLVVVVLMVVAGAGCSSGAKPTALPAAGQTSSTPQSTASAGQETALDVCQDQCHVPAGRHVLPDYTILPGLAFTLDDGWGATENDATEIHLVPPNNPSDAVFLWRDIRAVKSTGAGAGTQLLPGVGPTPSALVSWITSNPDFDVINQPKPVTIGQGIPATQLTVQVSHTARFDNPDCPDNPRCAAFFKGAAWPGDLFYAIGGDETVQMLFATAPFDGRTSTLIIATDAMNPNDLHELQRATQPFLDSLRLPNA